jgi:hypothetical protein
VLRCDNGPELAGQAMADWAHERVSLPLHPARRALAQRLHRVVQRSRPRRMPEHQHLLESGPRPGRDQRLEGRLQPPTPTQRARLPTASGLRCWLRPPMTASHTEGDQFSESGQTAYFRNRRSKDEWEPLREPSPSGIFLADQ